MLKDINILTRKSKGFWGTDSCLDILIAFAMGAMADLRFFFFFFFLGGVGWQPRVK